MALSDLSVTTEFLCLLGAVVLARAGAAPEDTTGSELVRLLVAIQVFLSLDFKLDFSILANFTLPAAKSFYQFHHNFESRDVSDHVLNDVRRYINVSRANTIGESAPAGDGCG